MEASRSRPPSSAQRAERRAAPAALLVVAAIFAVLSAISIVAIDEPVARALAGYEKHHVWVRGIAALEWAIGWPIDPLFITFALTGAMLVVIAVPRLRPHAHVAIFLAGTHAITRVATGELKELTGRLRPLEWLAAGGDGTFWRGGLSFPSGHVALFSGLVISLAVVWRRARVLLVLIPFVAAARIGVSAHFVSDTLSAVALVALVAWVVGAGVRPLRH